MKPKLICIAILALTIAAGVPGAASAQSNDPSAGSPSGTIYELPLDDARNDAAPRDPSGKSTAGTISPIRSDNGFGSSSAVPGATTAQAGSGGSSGASSGGSPAKSGSSKGKKDAPKRPGTSSGESRIPVAGVVSAKASGGSPSLWRSALLLLLGVVVAAGLAAGARTAGRRR
jgi:hypothetical protein